MNSVRGATCTSVDINSVDKDIDNASYSIDIVDYIKNSRREGFMDSHLKTQTATKELPRLIKGCPRCGGRLFVETDYDDERLYYFLECSIGCGTMISLNGEGPAFAAMPKPSY